MDFALIKRLTVSQRRAPRQRRSGRDARGMYIVEALVAMVIAGIISFALLDMVCGSMRAMNRAGNDSQAYEIVEELTEYTRAFGYQRLLLYKDQPLTLVINKVDGVTFQRDDFHNRALLLDFVRRQWNSKAENGRFEGTLTYLVKERPDPDTLDVSIDLEWTDTQTGNKRNLGRVIVVWNVP